ncbi:MAG: TIGR04211 family SH3 domain-containing protein [Deltaproteobacteria bacterium]|nr:MAG: TIGR04211 family SH3 domain-containing protein [Deltaproteobacteria bacterium]
MKKALLGLGVFLCIVAFWTPSFGATAYVTDSFKITLRTGPSTENKIVSLLPSGQPLEVMETEGDWSHVKVLGKGEPPPEGWVLSRYLVERLPWKKQAKTLRAENLRLKDKLNQIQKNLLELKQENSDLKKQLDDTTKAFKDVSSRYKSLRQGAADYLKLKEKYAVLKQEMEKSQSEIERLTRENNQYRYSEKKKWFALGALVLLCGLLIGIIIGRQQRKRRSYLY